MPIPITLQTFGVFLTLLLLGGKYGTLSIVTYILLGIVGLPVFSGFSGGVATIIGYRGGYIIGFLIVALIFWLFEKSRVPKAMVLIMGLMCCYIFGSVWYALIYSNGGFKEIILLCCIPYILPDVLKLIISFVIVKRIKSKTQYS